MKEHAEGTTIYGKIIIEIALISDEDSDKLFDKFSDEVQNPIVDLLDGLDCPDFTFRVDES